MPNVRVAWYSEDKLCRYHVCRNCHYNDDILCENLAVETEAEVIKILRVYNENTTPKTLFCDECERLLCRGVGITFTIPVL